MPYLLEAKLIREEVKNVEVKTTHKTAKKAALAAWEFCEENDLDMPSSEWWTDTGTYGEQECYNVMVPAGDWEPKDAFVKYMTKHASTVKLTGGDDDKDFISISGF